jgi:hypothetical protein
MEPFTDLKWNNSFEMFSLVKINTIPDGNCYFHSLMLSFFKPYQNNKNIEHRKNMSKKLRNELSKILEEPSEDGKTRYYDILSRGFLEEMSKSIPSYSIEEMKDLLNSNNHVSNEFHELVSELFNKDIYILDVENEDVYRLPDIDIYYKGRNSIILLYTPGHYDLLGIKENDKLVTHFKPDHCLIEYISSRLNS